jgi:hypothetical protein
MVTLNFKAFPTTDLPPPGPVLNPSNIESWFPEPVAGQGGFGPQDPNGQFVDLARSSTGSPYILRFHGSGLGVSTTKGITGAVTSIDLIYSHTAQTSYPSDRLVATIDGIQNESLSDFLAFYALAGMPGAFELNLQLHVLNNLTSGIDTIAPHGAGDVDLSSPGSETLTSFKVFGFKNIENVDDHDAINPVTVTGSSGANNIKTGAGDDTIDPGGGNDTVDGGAGTDSVHFSGTLSAYTLTNLGFASVRAVGPDGTDTLTNIEKLVFADQTVTWPLEARDDFNGDNHGDILWARDDGTVSIWDGGQIGNAHIIANAGAVPASWHIAGRGDFDGNGHGDILWRNDNGAVSLWDNGQIGGAHIIANAGVVSNSWHISGTGDFDGNMHSDILWRNDNGAVSIWDNGQIGSAHIIANPGVVSNSWHISGTGDFDGNRHSDILWRNDNGAVSIWDNGAIGGAHIVANAGVVASSWHISGTGDFDGNGVGDILWRNDNGAVSIWDNGSIGGAHIIANAGVVPNSWHIADTGNFDGNGQSDVLWRNDNGAVSIWDNGDIAHAHIIADPGVVPVDWHIV